LAGGGQRYFFSALPQFGGDLVQAKLPVEGGFVQRRDFLGSAVQSRRLQAQAPAAGLRLERLPVSLASSGPGERSTEAGWTCEAKAGPGAARRAEAEETRVGAADFRDARKPGEGLEQHGGSELRHRGERELTYHFTTPADFARDRHAGYSIQLF